jgi:protein-tyrosine phosphatase
MTSPPLFSGAEHYEYDPRSFLLQEDMGSAFYRISHIIDNLHLSGIYPLQRNRVGKSINENKIDIIISMTENEPKDFNAFLEAHPAVAHHHFPAIDDGDCDISQHFDATYDILEAAHYARKRVLVHCNEGKSRSATIVAAFLYRFLDARLAMDEVLAFIKKKRPLVDPNPKFMEYLRSLSSK